MNETNKARMQTTVPTQKTGRTAAAIASCSTVSVSGATLALAAALVVLPIRFISRADDMALFAALNASDIENLEPFAGTE